MSAAGGALDAPARAALEAGLAQLRYPADPVRLAALERYAAELLRWNRQTNLTAITDPQEVVRKHLLDCLAALPLELDGSLCDVGSGAGLPGLLWARECPALSVQSLDARRRKVAFQQQMARQWGLQNFRAVHQRVEDARTRHDWVSFRAFAPLPRALPQIAHLLGEGGSVLALKGPGVESELAELDSSDWRYTMSPLQVPGLDAERCVVRIQRADDPAGRPLQFRS